MIDPTVLRQSVNEHLQNHLAYPADVMAWVMKCGDLLDENAALRERVTRAEAERDTFSAHVDRVEDENTALESRLAALKAAGRALVAQLNRLEFEPIEDQNAIEAFEQALLRSDP